MNNEYQLRSETTGVRITTSLTAALQDARNDPTVWKISYTSPSGEVIRLVRQPDDSFKNEPIMEIIKQELAKKGIDTNTPNP